MRSLIALRREAGRTVRRPHGRTAPTMASMSCAVKTRSSCSPSSASSSKSRHQATISAFRGQAPGTCVTWALWRRVRERQSALRLRIGAVRCDTAVDARSRAQKQCCEHLHASWTHPPHTSKHSSARRGRRLTGNRRTRPTAVHVRLQHAVFRQCSKRAVARRHVQAACI